MKKIALYVLFAVFLLTSASVISEPLKKIIQPIPDYSTLQKQITSYLDEQPGVYGLYFIDIHSGQKFGYNSRTVFHAASTFKVPMNLYLYRAADNGQLSLTEQLTFTDQHMEGGTGILQNKSPGGSYSIEQLADYSILYSDNVATNILLDRLGKQNVKDFMRSLGGQVVDNKQNSTCPYDLALYMQEAVRLADQPAGERLFNNLLDNKLKDRIPEPLPPEIKVANKIGTWPPTNTYNDAAYVDHPKRPYILVVTSKDTPGYSEALAVIHQLSEQIYRYQTNRAT
ncbi:serine hydrolase [Desulfoscipio sp. XC116]|uniref:serine hydrolase n=1 Tax=Desulfoscipio sp. XC116 TaxID=3144975 RepID=UPI00325B4DC4